MPPETLGGIQRLAQISRKDVADLKKREIDNSITPRSDRANDYTTFGQLSVIITSNWDIFGTIFKSPALFSRLCSV